MSQRSRLAVLIAVLLVIGVGIWMWARARLAVTEVGGGSVVEPPHPAPTKRPRRPVSSLEPEVDRSTNPTSDALADPTRDPERAILSGWVVFTDGALVPRAQVISSDCPLRVAAEDGFFQAALGAERCRIQARLPDGLLMRRSDWLEVGLHPGRETEVELILPRERTGGLGVELREHPDGVELVRVLPGTPGAAMGLEAGDVVTAVDGIPAAALSLADFIEVATGPEGTEIAFRLRPVGDTAEIDEELVLTRTYLDRSLLGPPAGFENVHTPADLHEILAQPDSSEQQRRLARALLEALEGAGAAAP